MSRVRKPTAPRRVRKARFVNPYPQMSEPEARVHLFLEGINVPFSWRNFDGGSLAPNFKWLMPTFVPEFTLTEYRAVILIIGNYWGSIPGMLDQNGLAAALLESDGWKVAVLWESDVVNDTALAVTNALPELRRPALTGPPKSSPWSYASNYLKRMREYAGMNSFRRRKWTDAEGDWANRTGAIRKPKRGDRRNPTRVTRTVRPDETKSLTGKSRLGGRYIGQPRKRTPYDREELSR